VLEVAGLSGDDKEAERGIVLRAIDKLDRLGIEGVRALLGAGRRDESGDFTKGANLATASVEKILEFLGANDAAAQQLYDAGDLLEETDLPSDGLIDAAFSANAETGSFVPRSLAQGQLQRTSVLRILEKIVGISTIGQEGVLELREIATLLNAQGYSPDRIVIDPSVVRGLGYYTGPVFEAELTFETLDEKGVARQFGSVAGGGRYDDLVKRFTGQEVPATGVSIGVDRLLAALAERNKGMLEKNDLVVVTVMDRDRMADYLAIVANLRKSNIRAEVYLGNPKNFGNQLKYADKRNAAFAIIQGEDEHARGVVQIKDLKLGARLAATVTHEEWKDQPAQFECALGDLVAEITKRLGCA